MTLKIAIERFVEYYKFSVKTSTIKGYERILKGFCLYWRNAPLESITINHVIEYYSSLQDLGWQPNSFVTITAALKKFFEFYKKQELKVLNPDLIPMPAKEFNIPRVLDTQSYQKLLQVIPKDSNDPRHIRNLAIIGLLWDSGARNGEIVSLEASDVSTGENKAIIRTEKSRGKRPFREIFWTDNTNLNLKTWINKRATLPRHTDALFISCCGEKVGHRLTIKGVSEMLRQYSNRADLPIVANAHSFRHHFGRDIIEKGGNITDVSNFLGHASLQSSFVYSMLWGKNLEKRYKYFNNHEQAKN